jgi:hypothetical protein
MKNSDLAQKVKFLGFPLFERKEAMDANATLAEVVTSKDLRLWEGFPVMLAHSVREKLFDYDVVVKHLKTSADKKVFAQLVGVARALYATEGYAPEGFRGTAAGDVKELGRHFNNNEPFAVGGKRLSPERLRNVFLNYAATEDRAAVDFKELKGDFDLTHAFLQLLSPKQKELFFKKLRREKMTKTEREYYSRVVRKKVAALANPELHHLAQQVALAD